MNDVEEVPAPTVHLKGCMHVEGAWRCSLPHAHRGPHELGLPVAPASPLDARVAELERKVRDLEHAANRPAELWRCWAFRACTDPAEAARGEGICLRRNRGVNATECQACPLPQAEVKAP